MYEKNIALRLSYTGTAYHGWQVQKNGITVAETLEKQSQELAHERAALCKAAEARLDQAATQIFERIVRHGHS